MKLKLKIFSGFFILALILLIASVISVYELLKVGQSVTEMLDDNYRSINASTIMLEALEREDSGILLLIMGHWDQGRKTIESGDSLFRKGFDIARNNLTIPGEDKYIERLEISYKKYAELCRMPIAGTVRQGDITWYYEMMHQTFLEVKKSIFDLMELNQGTMYRTSTALENRAHKAVMPGIIAIIASIVFSALFYYFVHTYVVRPIIKITLGVEEFNESRKPFRVEVDTNDEIKNLSDSIKRLLVNIK